MSPLRLAVTDSGEDALSADTLACIRQLADVSMLTGVLTLSGVLKPTDVLKLLVKSPVKSLAWQAAALAAKPAAGNPR